MGLHAPQINVPYCQILFSDDTLTEFMREAELAPISFTHCNRWSRAQFRALFASFADRLETVSYAEDGAYQHLDLVERYAPIFRARTGEFDNLTCSAIRVLFKNR